MMKLVRVKVDGFRLLSGLEINFSTDQTRNITVVRAANESGKTTLLSALQWGLIGDGALPNGYKIRAMDLPDSEVVETKVEIEYEVENRNGPQRFLIVRSVKTKGDDRTTPKSDLDMFRITNSGYDPEAGPFSHLEQHFPAELREVFFTDGDRALSFIEGPRAEQQHKVRAAIEKMMGLSILESTIDHIKTNEKKIRAKFAKESGNSETRQVEKDLEGIDIEIPILLKSSEKLKDEIANLNDHHQKADRDLQEALKLGNRAEIAKELKETQVLHKRIEVQRKTTELRQSELLSSVVLSKHMLSGPFKRAQKLLDDLRLKGIIPNKTIPVLEDRLAHSDCICGESLDINTVDGKRRRLCIETLIEQSQEADSMREKVSELYFEGKPLFSGVLDSWNELYSSAFEERQNIRSVYEDLGQREADLEVRLNEIPDTDVQKLREIRETYSNKLRQLTVDITRLEGEIKRKRTQKTDLEQKFRTYSARAEKGERTARELNVAVDMRLIVERSLEHMKTLEVKRVSDTMNRLFLQMIGADEENSLITRAEITPEFRILVFGRGDFVMDPSLDLNGASRRALTLAFVLALAEISGVEAPNVIDTPLGMMSGFVKTEVVKISSDKSAQLILLLTHDEIKGCEDILSERAAKGCTLTNPAHYPIILKNDPKIKEARVISCDCDHNSTCTLCDRFENSSVKEDA
jgi:DNA sulfur modification protein DndD